jgi:hypothetical protein
VVGGKGRVSKTACTSNFLNPGEAPLGHPPPMFRDDLKNKIAIAKIILGNFLPAAGRVSRPLLLKKPR